MVKIFTQYEVMRGAGGRIFRKNHGASEFMGKPRIKAEVPKRTLQTVIYRDHDIARGYTHCYLDWET